MTRANHLPCRSTRAAIGALAGAVATVPMTAAMAAIYFQLTSGRRHSPPPHQVTMEIADELGLGTSLTLADRLSLTILAHFGYGAAAGAAYGMTAAHAPLPSAVKGTAFGCFVWAGSYLGWLPAAGFRAAAPNQSGQRNAMMLAAHVVWGGSLGMLSAEWTSGRRRFLRCSSTTSDAETPGPSSICRSSPDRS